MNWHRQKEIQALADAQKKQAEQRRADEQKTMENVIEEKTNNSKKRAVTKINIDKGIIAATPE